MGQKVLGNRCFKESIWKKPYFCLFNKMIYPENFENKIGFDRIRNLLSEKCLSPMGLEMVEAMQFSTSFDYLENELSATREFQQVLTFEDFFPAENYYRISDTLNKIRIEGTFPEVQEVYDLKTDTRNCPFDTEFFQKQGSG
jgi:DNA mismatch repair protein MutS2